MPNVNVTITNKSKLKQKVEILWSWNTAEMSAIDSRKCYWPL